MDAVFRLLLPLVFCGPLAAQPPIAVTATEQVDLGDPVRIVVVTEGKGLLVRVRQVLPGEDLDASENLLALRDVGQYAFTHRSPGGYVVEAQAVVGDEIVTASAFARIGVAPGPGPDPPPDPPPLTVGPRKVLILHETADTTPQWARTLVDLRSGPAAKYLSEQKHRLWILDDDDADPKWVKTVEGITLPAVVVMDERGAIVFRGACPAKPEEIIALVKQHGG